MKRLKFYAELALEPDGTITFKVRDHTVGVRPIGDGSTSDGLRSALDSIGTAITKQIDTHQSQPSDDESSPS